MGLDTYNMDMPSMTNAMDIDLEDSMAVLDNTLHEKDDLDEAEVSGSVPAHWM